MSWWGSHEVKQFFKQSFDTWPLEVKRPLISEISAWGRSKNMGGAKSLIKSRDYSFRYKSTVYNTVSYDQLKVGVLGSSITSVKRWKGTETLSARKTKDGNAIARVYRDVCNMSEYFHENGADVLHFKVGYDAPGENPPSNHSDG